MADYERPMPYVGVSGVVNEAQAAALEKIAGDAGLLSTKLLLLGVKATHKTQFDDQPNRHGADWFPVGERIAYVLGAAALHDPRLAVAQVFFDEQQVEDPAYREDFLYKLMGRTHEWLTGLQFDLLPWHRADMTAFLAEARRGEFNDGQSVTVLLQCHGQAMETLGPKEAVRQLGEYALAGGIDYVLFDASHGKGAQLDVESLQPFLEEAYASEALHGVGIGIAGGLDERAIQEVMPALLVAYPDLSWDAEGKLHPMLVDGRRPLDLALAHGYLQASARVLATQI